MFKVLFGIRYLKIVGMTFMLSLLFSITHAITILDDVYDISIEKPYSFHTSYTEYENNIFKSFASFDNIKLDNSNSVNSEKLISYYCLSVQLNWWVYKDLNVYSLDKSVFLYLMCSNINEKNIGFFDKTNPDMKSYLKVSKFNKLWLSVNEKDKGLVHLYVHDLFDNIINEYFNIKQAHVYWLETAKEEKKSIEEQANEFSSGYFLWVNICSNDDPNYSYKKTCIYLKDYMRSVKSMVNGLNILDVDKMYDDYLKKSKEPGFCEMWDPQNYNIILCGLWWKPGEKDFKTFVNLVYNELYYYNLFVQYYDHWLSKGDNSLAWSIWSLDLISTYSQQQKVKRILSENLKRSQDALGVSLKMLTDSYVTFPIHIWMLMYWETLSKFGKEISKIAPPIYTLYDKLRNVQCEKK